MVLGNQVFRGGDGEPIPAGKEFLSVVPQLQQIPNNTLLSLLSPRHVLEQYTYLSYQFVFTSRHVSHEYSEVYMGEGQGWVLPHLLPETAANAQT